MVRCISCAQESLDNLRHPITYKSVIKHYEHVLHLVAELAGKNGDRVFNWPPDAEVIEAAGGVGFGCLQLVSEYDGLVQVTQKLSLNYFTPKLSQLNPKMHTRGQSST